MVSLIRKFSCVFFMSALVLVCLLMPAELKASQPCCKNGKISQCPNLPNGQQYDLSGCQGGISPVDPVVPVNPGLEIEIGGEVFLDECTSGQAQYKPSGDCGTSKRTCCSNKQWSAWGGSCPTCNKSADTCDARQLYADFDEANCKCICPTGAKEVNGTCECDTANGYVEGDHECVKNNKPSCGSNQCWNGSKCEAKGSTSKSCVGAVQETTGGTLTRTATCSSGYGWSYGSWTGTCTCPSGKTWTGSGLSGYCKGNFNGYWVCDHGSIISWNGCPTDNPLRGYSCSDEGATATAYEDIGAGQCEMASCTCE